MSKHDCFRAKIEEVKEWLSDTMDVTRIPAGDDYTLCEFTANSGWWSTELPSGNMSLIMRIEDELKEDAYFGWISEEEAEEVIRQAASEWVENMVAEVDKHVNRAWLFSAACGPHPSDEQKGCVLCFPACDNFDAAAKEAADWLAAPYMEDRNELADWWEDLCGEEWEGSPQTAEEWAIVEEALKEHAYAAAMDRAELQLDEFGPVGITVDFCGSFDF